MKNNWQTGRGINSVKRASPTLRIYTGRRRRRKQWGEGEYVDGPLINKEGGRKVIGIGMGGHRAPGGEGWGGGGAVG